MATSVLNEGLRRPVRRSSRIRSLPGPELDNPDNDLHLPEGRRRDDRGRFVVSSPSSCGNSIALLQRRLRYAHDKIATKSEEVNELKINKRDLSRKLCMEQAAHASANKRLKIYKEETESARQKREASF